MATGVSGVPTAVDHVGPAAASPTAIVTNVTEAEVAASRRRIVAASDEARRRIERDLHDGTQQRLVSLALALRAAEDLVPSDLGDLRSELSQIAAALDDALTELQEIARGIHPANLSRGGLEPALRTLARRSPIPVDVEIVIDGRLPEPVEVAAYYVASEALANAAKHSHASRVAITLELRGNNAVLTIRDDGVGGADLVKGSGLVGIADRVHALGGAVQIRSAIGRGTLITIEIPIVGSVGLG